MLWYTSKVQIAVHVKWWELFTFKFKSLHSKLEIREKSGHIEIRLLCDKFQGRTEFHKGTKVRYFFLIWLKANKLCSYVGVRSYKTVTLNFSQNLIKTPSGDFKQVSEEFYGCSWLDGVLRVFLWFSVFHRLSKNHQAPPSNHHP